MEQVIPSVAVLCTKVGVASSAVGIIMGCCDIAAMPGTVGARASTVPPRRQHGPLPHYVSKWILAESAATPRPNSKPSPY